MNVTRRGVLAALLFLPLLRPGPGHASPPPAPPTRPGPAAVTPTTTNGAGVYVGTVATFSASTDYGWITFTSA